MTAVAELGAEFWARCHRTARDHGLAPGLELLRSAALPDLLPCGPGGHALVPATVASSAERVWLGGATISGPVDWETIATANPPGGTVVVLRHAARTPVVNHFSADERDAWLLGLSWLRLGLSEALRDTCVHHLAHRPTGNSTLLQQQLVKGALADALIEQWEIRAVLGDVGGSLTDRALWQLHSQITRTDRGLVHLLGAHGYLTGGAGQVADLSELLADVNLARGEMA